MFIVWSHHTLSLTEDSIKVTVCHLAIICPQLMSRVEEQPAYNQI